MVYLTGTQQYAPKATILSWRDRLVSAIGGARVLSTTAVDG